MVQRRAAIGKLIKFYRNAAGLTQVEAARGVGVPWCTWLRWETGRLGVPTEMLPDVAHLIGMPLRRVVRLAAQAPHAAQAAA